MMLHIIAATALMAQANAPQPVLGLLEPLTEGVRTVLSEGKPVGVKLGAAPSQLQEPLQEMATYGVLQFDGDAYVLAVLVKEDGTWQFAIDLDRNNRFGENEMLMTHRLETVVMGTDQKPFELISYVAQVTLKRIQDRAEIEYPIGLAAAVPAPTSPAPKETVVVVRDYARKGTAVFGGRTLNIVLDDPGLRGNFAYDGEGSVALVLRMDFNGDGNYSPRTEQVPIGRSFRLNGEAYKVTKIDAPGSVVTFSPVDDTATFFDTRKGAKISPFTAPTLYGKTLRFPEDFAGKKVLFFFWATGAGCDDQMQRMSAILEQTARRGMTIIGVNLDPAEKKEAAERAAWRDMGKAVHIFEGIAQGGPIARRLGVTDVPAMMVVDADSLTILAGTGDARYSEVSTWVKEFWPEGGR
jgi:hypothetical protein